MGQKVNPFGFRLIINKNWNSRWYANNKQFPFILKEDLKIRSYIKKKLKNASISNIIIERLNKKIKIIIYSSRPGIIIGKKGEGVELLKANLSKLIGINLNINIEEIRKPEINSQLIANSIAQQLEKRIMFRRAMKRAIQNVMRFGTYGVKIMLSGRLNGIEIARKEWYCEGKVPLHTMMANISYAFSEAKTSYGIIGIKVWLCESDKLTNNNLSLISKLNNILNIKY